MPTGNDWNGVRHVFRYFRKTSNYKLAFERSGLPMEAYSDADWADDLNDCTSFSGYCILFGGEI